MLTSSFNQRALRLITPVAIAAALLLPLAASAQDHGLIANCAYAANETTPGLKCVIDQLILVGRFLFGITGTAALLMFTLGGFFILTAQGPDGVKKGKKYMTNAAIGIVIILTAAYVIQYGVNVLRAGQDQGSACKGQTYSDDGGVVKCCETPGLVQPTGKGSGFKCSSGG
jgi:hypothetical protein